MLSYKEIKYDSSEKYIIVFFDYTCPFCELFDNNIQNISNSFDVSLIYIHRPLLQSDSSSFNAALAVECANEQDNFSKMHAYLLQRNDQLHKLDFINLGREIGINNFTKYTQCYRSKKFASTIEKENHLADSLLIEAVPAFIINDKLFEGIMNVEQLKKELNISHSFIDFF